MLVLSRDADHINLGFQRNREAAELTEYLEKGKDRLDKEQADFKKRMQKRLARLSEAMDISPTGKPNYQWELARENYSHILGVMHEVISLPPISVSKGETWRDATIPGLEFRWLNDESVHGKLCRHVEGTSPDRSLKLSYWWSAESGVLEQIAVDANYRVFDQTAHETAQMELESRTRDEPLEKWLASGETRLAALQAALLTPNYQISAAQLTPVIASSDSSAQALALAIVSARNMDLPPADLSKFRRNTNGATQPSTELLQAELQLLDEPKTGTHPPLVDECRHPVALKTPSVKFGTKLETTADAQGLKVPYLLRVPLSYRVARPSPLLIYLSGGAGFAMDGINSAEDVVSQTDYLVLYPQAAAYWWSSDAVQRFDAVFNDVLQRYNVDRNRVFITGYSNGGTGALYYGMLWPQRFAAVVSLMGAGQCIDQLKGGLPNLKNLPILFVHGRNDSTIQPECSKSTEASLMDLQPAIKPQLIILPNHGHDISLQNDDGLTLAFFRDKVRNPFPRKLDMVEFDSFSIHNYWLEILSGTPGRSSLEAHVKPDNTIEIHSHDIKKIRLYLRKELLLNPGDLKIVWNSKKLFSGPLRDYCWVSSTTGRDAGGLVDPADLRDLTLP